MSRTRSTTSRLSLQLDLLDPPVRGLILDVDGVLWKDAEPIGDLAAVFGAISAMGLIVTVATNNAMGTVDEYRLKLHGFGVDLEPWQIITSAEATADALAVAFPQGGSLFVVGERGLIEALRGRGFEVVTDASAERQYAAVVAGIDRELTYLKLQKAATLVREGAPFYGTNPDRTFPTPTGLVPGAGAVLAAIASAAGKEPIVVGKPSPLLFQIAAGRMQLSIESLLIVGDRLETDVAGGQAFGARTALVLSGVSTEDQARAWRPSPTLVAPSLSDLVGV
ncbi:MAG: HAD-IIA family hydrolase [Chloroflexota bacterium]